jgi:hypothetical protein
MATERPAGVGIVEFFGVPGVGKSYLVARAVPGNVCCPLGRFSRIGRGRRVFEKMAVLVRNFSVATATARWARDLIAISGPKNLRRGTKVGFNWMFIASIIRGAAAEQRGLIVLDQGLAQALWSTRFMAEKEFCSHSVSGSMKRSLASLPISEWTVVHVATTDERIQERIGGRMGRSPLDVQPDLMVAARTAENETRQVIDILAQEQDGLPKIRVIDLENSGGDEIARLRALMGWDR